MSRRLIHNAHLVDSDKDYARGWVVIEGEHIADFGEGCFNDDTDAFESVVDARGAMLMPGVIDEHVHFRQPGLTHKADIASESAAAAAGGVTSFFDMPNTKPATVTHEAWEEKMELAANNSIVNYAFFIGATPENQGFIKEADYSRIPGIKLFMGSTTGSKGAADEDFLDNLFKTAPAVIAVHAEDDNEIRRAQSEITARYPDPPVHFHSKIRNARACYMATARIASLARTYGKRAHVMHLTTAAELEFFKDGPVENKLLTCETCPQYLIFSGNDYATLGSRIKCNPSIKDESDRRALIEALTGGRIDTIGTDHAPHLISEKEGGALKAASGMPGVQFALPVMLELARKHNIDFPTVSRLMAGNPALLWKINKRGFIRRGYYADLVLLVPHEPYAITDAHVLSRCAWTPYNNFRVGWSVSGTWVNGREVYNDRQGVDRLAGAAMPVTFGN